MLNDCMIMNVLIVRKDIKNTTPIEAKPNIEKVFVAINVSLHEWEDDDIYL